MSGSNPHGRATAFVNVRLVDPESGYDGPGALVMAEGVIADVQRRPAIEGLSADVRVIDGGGAVLCPGLVDLRVKTGEPGAEPKETLKSAARAAAAGGVTSIVLQPDTDPAIDDPAMVDFLLRRGRDLDLVHIYAAGAATPGLRWQGPGRDRPDEGRRAPSTSPTPTAPSPTPRCCSAC